LYAAVLFGRGREFLAGPSVPDYLHMADPLRVFSFTGWTRMDWIGQTGPETLRLRARPTGRISMNIASARTAMPPFDQARVDRLMEEAGIDVLFATSKHNTQYLLGGYKFIFFSAMDAIGHSRYLPIVIYEKGGPDHAAYIGNRMEGGEHQNNPFWTPTLVVSQIWRRDAKGPTAR
jgi:hypothetical protein